MAKQKTNKKKQRRANKQGATKSTNQQAAWWRDNTTNILLGMVIALTFLAYIPSINNGFVNWDDPDYVTANPTIIKVNSENIKTMFTGPIASNYHPLTMISLMVDYQFSDHDENGNLIGRPFHISSLLLHLLTTVLVFWFIFLLSRRNREISLLVALLFAIHPMHVESVAWVSERKDVLYALFFFAGLIAYMKYLGTQLKLKYLVWTMVFFILSCLSKPTAVLFSPVLILIDFYVKRNYMENGNVNLRAIVEKIPFFLGSLIFGLVTYNIQKSVAVGGADAHSIGERFMYASYGVMMYIVKMIVPYDMAAFYPYPDKANLPIIFKVAPVIVAALLALTAWSFKKTRVVLFGMGFFLGMNVLTLQFLTVGRAIMSDRYTYIPYVGLFFIIAYGLDYLMKNKPNLKNAITGAAVAYCLVLTVLTFQQAKVWTNSDTLWTQVKKVSPQDPTAYNNLGNYYYSQEKNTEKAMKSLNEAIRLDPRMFDAYISRGKIYRQTGKLDLAMKDYDIALSIKQSDHSVFNNRGNVYFSMKQYDKAVADYKKVIEMDPADSKAYGNIGAVFAATNRFPQALEYLDKAIKLFPNYADAYLNRGVIYSQTNEPKKAVDNYSSFIKLTPDNPSSYYYRGQDYAKLGKQQAALDDFTKAIQLNPNYSFAYKARGELYNIMGQAGKGAADLQKYTQIGDKKWRRLQGGGDFSR